MIEKKTIDDNLINLYLLQKCTAEFTWKITGIYTKAFQVSIVTKISILNCVFIDIEISYLSELEVVYNQVKLIQQENIYLKAKQNYTNANTQKGNDHALAILQLANLKLN